VFYPCSVEFEESEEIKQALVVLTPAESKRLLAKTVAALPEVRAALKNGRVIVPSGSSMAFVLEELTGERVEPYRYSMGFIAEGMLTMSAPEDRIPAALLVKGERVDTPYPEFIKTMEKGDVIIKGATALDADGNVGVLLSNENGGMVGAYFGVASARGIPVIMPVGLEKMIASVPEVSYGWGQTTLSYSTGLNLGIAAFPSGLVITEIEAFALMANVHARHVSSGGIGGSEGAVVLLLEGQGDDFKNAIDLVESVKGEPAIAVPRHQLS
jgi:hypothetical protein